VLAGPAVQIGVSLAVLFAMGIDPLDRNSYASSAPALAIWWTGPVMGLFNLVPVLPLDGGHVVLAALDRIIPAHSRRLMLWFSIALTVVGGIYLFLHPRYNGFVYFVIFPLLVQIQMLTAGKQQSAAQRSPLARAESMAWAETLLADAERMEPKGAALLGNWLRGARGRRLGG
jgi:Zn-dependent protease